MEFFLLEAILHYTSNEFDFVLGSTFQGGVLKDYRGFKSLSVGRVSNLKYKC